MTFLDMVRALAERTHKTCDDCSMSMHIRDAAWHLGQVLDDPDLLAALAERSRS